MIELRAYHPLSNTHITERFIKGIRYIKVTPKSIMPLILEKLKKMFENKPVEFEVSELGWIKIEKIKRDEQMEKAIKKLGVKEEGIDERYVLEQEAKMLKSQGYVVKIKEINE